MKRLGTAIVLAAMAAALLAAAPSSSAPCTDGTVYKYCGDHLRFADLPLRFKVNTSGRPSGVSDGDVRTAVRDAAAAWDRAWPFEPDSIPTGSTGGSPGDCGHLSTKAICFDGAGSSVVFKMGDGVNAIVFGDPRDCPGGTSSANATACFLFDGANASGRRIGEVDIILNASKPWKHATDLVAGEINGAFPMSSSDPSSVFYGEWYDLQSVLTHELGHTLGLEHIGSSPPFPASLLGAESVKYRQSMYWYAYPRSTNARTLDAGDVAGLHDVAMDTYNDR